MENRPDVTIKSTTRTVHVRPRRNQSLKRQKGFQAGDFHSQDLQPGGGREGTNSPRCV